MTSKWNMLKDRSYEAGINQYIGEYVKIRQNQIKFTAELFGKTELFIIDSGRESSSEWEDGWIVLAKTDYEK